MPLGDYVEAVRAAFAPYAATHHEAVRTTDGWRLNQIKLTATYPGPTSPRRCGNCCSNATTTRST
jgi:hypothetical protein